MPTRSRPKHAQQAEAEAADSSEPSVISEESEVVLRLDASADSAKARRVFNDARVPFVEVAASGPRVPTAEFGGLAFVGIERMRALASGLREFDTILLDGVRKNLPHLFAADTSRDEQPHRRPARNGDASASSVPPAERP